MTVDFPFLVLGLSFGILAFSAKLGDYIRTRSHDSEDKPRDDLGIVLAGTLTLLGLIIGFSFSMATTRYELRKSCEQIEANAIATQWARADLLPPADAPKVQELLQRYLGKRLLFYTVRNRQQLKTIASETSQLQDQLWSTIRSSFASAPPPVQGMLISGLNDVVNSESSTQAAFDNRVPLLAWLLIVRHRIWLQLLDRFARPSHGLAGLPGDANCRIDLTLFDRRPRQPARRSDLEWSQEPHSSFTVALKRRGFAVHGPYQNLGNQSCGFSVLITVVR